MCWSVVPRFSTLRPGLEANAGSDGTTDQHMNELPYAYGEANPAYEIEAEQQQEGSMGCGVLSIANANNAFRHPPFFIQVEANTPTMQSIQSCKMYLKGYKQKTRRL